MNLIDVIIDDEFMHNNDSLTAMYQESSKIFDFELIVQGIKMGMPFDKEVLAKREDLTLDALLKHPEIGMYLSEETLKSIISRISVAESDILVKTLDFRLIINGVKLGLHFNKDILSKRFDLTLDIILATPDLWDYLNWDIVSQRGDLTHMGYKYGNDLWFIRHSELWSRISWKGVSYRHDMPINVIVQYPQIWDKLDWNAISCRQDTTFEKVIYYHQLWPYFNWSLMCNRPDFKIQDFIDHKEIHMVLDWKILTQRCDTYPQYFTNHPNLPWNLKLMMNRSDLGEDIIKYVAKARHIIFDIANPIFNKAESFPFPKFIK